MFGDVPPGDKKNIVTCVDPNYTSKRLKKNCNGEPRDTVRSISAYMLSVHVVRYFFTANVQNSGGTRLNHIFYHIKFAISVLTTGHQ